MEEFIVLFDSSSWIMAREFMMTGKPPLFTQILVLNTLALIFWIVRRMRGASALRAQTANTVQALLIAANCFVLLNGDFKLVDFSRVLNIFS
ncbi:MAG: hypothetical protein HKN11_15760 [Rhizobiales bacterium]|nr:hypothetical protein [Hyphomicrobiales bacterium]